MAAPRPMEDDSAYTFDAFDDGSSSTLCLP